MLNQLALKGVGPAQQLIIDFKPRLNFLTGDMDGKGGAS